VPPLLGFALLTFSRFTLALFLRLIESISVVVVDFAILLLPLLLLK
jgi:hypothetical protein